MNEIHDDRWGETNLHDALRFLALDHAAKCHYLPALFPLRTFHMRFSDFETGSPLVFMAAFAGDLCMQEIDSPECRWWLTCLSGVLDSIDYSDTAHHWHARTHWENSDSAYSACFGLWDALQHLSQQALRAYGQPIQPPRRRCVEFLRLFSNCDDLTDH